MDCIIDGQLYIGNLASATTLSSHPELGITHIVSVCPEFSSDSPNHLTISVQDSEWEDLLIHLPRACQFIKTALDHGGKVLVHCVMGVSRSATVIAAYLMMTRRIPSTQAIAYIQQRRPKVLPNYGFLKQLEAFAACAYEPTPTSAPYRAWKRRQRQDVNSFLCSVSDTIPIIHDRLYLSSDFPSDVDQAKCLVAYLGMTHCISLTPSEDIPSYLPLKHWHVEIPDSRKEALLLSLPEICKRIQEAIDSRGRVLIHSLNESTAAVVACSFCESHTSLCPSAYGNVILATLPLFNRTMNFSKQLELFGACNYSPRLDHPAVQAWLGLSGSNAAPTRADRVSMAASSCVNTHMMTGSDRPKVSRKTVVLGPRAPLIGQS
ncbi:phosphatases II [Dentipellis sp. KUC8613]|nr:phosphatases II [Dentipellis sp. KUC8613]